MISDILASQTSCELATVVYW